jgi:site-specific recombinase XerD
MSGSNARTESLRLANQNQLEPLLHAYSLHLTKHGLSENTQIGHKHQISLFFTWLGEQNISDFALLAAPAQYATVLEYKAFLEIEKSAEQSTIKAALTAIDSFYEFLQLGRLAIDKDVG